LQQRVLSVAYEARSEPNSTAVLHSNMRESLAMQTLLSLTVTTVGACTSKREITDTTYTFYYLDSRSATANAEALHCPKRARSKVTLV
jgi:hypothetical protein